ncbi:MAG TPA: hypothetical protein VMZ28_08460 [Kofleriaceae bacterium]|nr:hypothetical protein [Kofleriaceae bacterium]
MRFLVAMTVLLLGASARADEAKQAPPAGVPAGTDRALAPAAAVVPGVLLHGAGHWVMGEKRTARRLLLLEGVGVAVAGTSGAILYATGASRHYAAPLVGGVVTGVGLFALSMAADLYGSVGAACAAGAPDREPSIQLESGLGYVHDPQFAYRAFAVVAARARWREWEAAPSGWFALDDDNQRLRLDGAYRLAGPGTARETGDGTRLEIQTAGTMHRYGTDRFRVFTGEAALAGRLDMVRLGRTLAGSFGEMSVGVAGEVNDYDEPGAGADLGEMLLVRFGYGMYLGRRGEVSIYYDHRRDTFAGGTSPGPGPGSGFMGFFGAAAELRVAGRWGLRGAFESGAARVAHLALTAEMGGSR